jgi:hypothetical protein
MEIVGLEKLKHLSSHQLLIGDCQILNENK